MDDDLEDNDDILDRIKELERAVSELTWVVETLVGRKLPGGKQ